MLIAASLVWFLVCTHPLLLCGWHWKGSLMQSAQLLAFVAHLFLLEVTLYGC
jgi:hypothetical protein